MAGPDSCPLTLLPLKKCRGQKQGGLDYVAHVAAQQPLVEITLEACRVSRLLQAGGSAEGPSENGNSRCVVLWKSSRNLGLACFPELPHGGTVQNLPL